jgi:choline dehydrogenase
MNGTLPSDLPEFAERAAVNQRSRLANLRKDYDFVVCGAGSSGSVIARRLAENPLIHVLLIEAGRSDNLSSITEPQGWPTNLGTSTDWGFIAEPNPHLNGRALSMSMGKVLGGGSSINVMVWARGHRTDWDFFAAETGDESWGYDAVSTIFREIENWQGVADPEHRGTGGPVFVQPSPDPCPAAVAMLAAAEENGIPVFGSQNGRMMEGEGGCAFTDVLVRNGKRHSIYRAYTYPYLDRPNLTVLTDAQVARVLLDRNKAVGVEVQHSGQRLRFGATSEVVLSLGAIQTPKLLMLSGIGDVEELRQFGIPLVQHLPGVGCNLQDHVSFGCIWEYREPFPPRNMVCEATLCWKTDPALDAPDLLFCQTGFPVPSAETAHRGTPPHGWTMFAGLAQPKSRGRVRLRSADPFDVPRLELNTLSHPDDIRTAMACVDFCRTLGNAKAFQPLVAREAMPGNLKGCEMERFVRDAAVTYWHQTCSAKMGRDPLSVVDSQLRVYGIDRLRIADGSVLPRVTTGNTMAPCVVIAEKAARAIRHAHGI